MVKEDAKKIQWRMSLTLAISDVVCLCTILGVVVLLRLLMGGAFSLSIYFSLFPLLAFFPVVFAMLELYPGALMPPQEELKRSCIAISVCYLFLGTATFFSRDADSYSRFIFIVSWFFSMGAVPLVRSLVRNGMTRKGTWGIPAILVGTGPAMEIMARNVRLRPRIGMKIVGMLSDEKEVGTLFEGVTVLGTLHDAATISQEFPGCYAIISEHDSCCELGGFLSDFDKYFSRIVLLTDAELLSQRWATTRDIGGMVGLEIRQNLLDRKRMLLKRLLDGFVAFCGLAVLSPFFAAMVIWIKLDDGGPVFFGHPRIGRGGRTIKVWKFRSMVCNADELLAKHLAECEESRAEWEATQKLKNDPRITRSGKFLRKTSLDELPQLWNVLIGELSLVGPRPIVEAEKARYKESYELYCRIIPGITGLWQISGRNLTTYDERIDLDLYYVRNWSIWFDLYILCKTIPVVLTGHGAF